MMESQEHPETDARAQEYMRRWEAKVLQSRSARDTLKRNILTAMRDKALDRLTVNFWGRCDDCEFNADLYPANPAMNQNVPIPAGLNPAVMEDAHEATPLSRAAEMYAEDYIWDAHHGFSDGPGSYGIFTFDAKTDKVKFEIWYIIETESYSHETL